MKKCLLIWFALCIGATGFTSLHRDVEKTNTTAARIGQQWQSATNDLAAAQATASMLQDEVDTKQESLRAAELHTNISPEMLEILEGGKTKTHAKGWAELRQQLGIGWNTSPEYVLVNKQAIKDVWYDKINQDGRLSGDAIQLLGLSHEEQAAVKAALTQARVGQWLNVQRSSPGGDIVAQLTITPPDPAFEGTQSNAFAMAITSALGSERAGLFLPDAWREFLSSMAPSQTETMTIRQTETDGQSDLVCEVVQRNNVSTMPVRYAHYPAFPLLKLFPSGWQGLAQEFNFTLPPSFNPQNP